MLSRYDEKYDLNKPERRNTLSLKIIVKYNKYNKNDLICEIIIIKMTMIQCIK